MLRLSKEIVRAPHAPDTNFSAARAGRTPRRPPYRCNLRTIFACGFCADYLTTNSPPTQNRARGKVATPANTPRRRLVRRLEYSGPRHLSWGCVILHLKDIQAFYERLPEGAMVVIFRRSASDVIAGLVDVG
jgi:hypothetical protein